jgi:hypothetical protein
MNRAEAANPVQDLEVGLVSRSRKTPSEKVVQLVPRPLKVHLDVCGPLNDDRRLDRTSLPKL